MPRLPVDGKKVIEHRITLGGVERESLKSLAASFRIHSIAGDEGLLDQLTDIDNVIGILATFGFLLELFGITDIFDFDDDAKAKAIKIKDRMLRMRSRRSRTTKPGHKQKTTWYDRSYPGSQLPD